MTTLLSSETHSPKSGSLADTLKLVAFPNSVKDALQSMAVAFGKNRPSHTDIFDEDYQEVDDFFKSLSDNDVCICVFESSKTTEEVDGKVKVRFEITDSPRTIGKGNRIVSLLAFLNKNDFPHYELLTTAPCLKTDFKVVLNAEGVSNKSIRILSLPGDYSDQLKAIGFTVISKPVSKVQSKQQNSSGTFKKFDASGPAKVTRGPKAVATDTVTSVAKIGEKQFLPFPTKSVAIAKSIAKTSSNPTELAKQANRFSGLDENEFDAFVLPSAQDDAETVAMKSVDATATSVANATIEALASRLIESVPPKPKTPSFSYAQMLSRNVQLEFDPTIVTEDKLDFGPNITVKENKLKHKKAPTKITQPDSKQESVENVKEVQLAEPGEEIKSVQSTQPKTDNYAQMLSRQPVSSLPKIVTSSGTIDLGPNMRIKEKKQKKTKV